MNAKEIATQWGVSDTWVTMLCKQNRIAGAEKIKGKWIIPDDAQKPDDAIMVLIQIKLIKEYMQIRQFLKLLKNFIGVQILRI